MRRIARSGFLVVLLLAPVGWACAQSDWAAKGFREVQRKDFSADDVAVTLFGSIEEAQAIYTHVDPVVDGVTRIYFFYRFPRMTTNLAVKVVTTDPDGTKHWFLKVNDQLEDVPSEQRVVEGLNLAGATNPTLNFWKGE